MHTELVYQQKHENIEILGKSINQKRISKLGKSKISEKTVHFKFTIKFPLNMLIFVNFLAKPAVIRNPITQMSLMSYTLCILHRYSCDICHPSHSLR